MKFKYYIKHLALILLISLTLDSPGTLGEETSSYWSHNLFKVDGIEVRGNRKIESEAIIEKINIKKGMILDRLMLKRGIRTIYNMKFFETVSAYRDSRGIKNILIFEVSERPVIKSISFSGNDDLNDDDLKEKLESKQFNILDINTIKADVRALTKLYEEKGYYLASVTYKITKVQGEKSVDLTFYVKEFDKVKVKKITVLGNRAFTDDQLKDIMETQENSLFSFMTGSGNFKEFNFKNDIERVKFFYKSKGYLQVNIGVPDVTVSEDKRWLFITFKVKEGPQFTVNKIYFEGELLFTREEFMDKISLKENETYSEMTLQQDIRTLTELYQDEGYAFANVLRTLELVPGENRVDVYFSFEKGKMAYFGEIIVKGNTKTRDKVVRRELKIHEGMRFSGSKLRESKENVVRLGFFEQGSVVFNTVAIKGRDDILNLEISVKERNTGQISIGAGYSTATEGFIRASVAQKNFMGLGQELSLSLDLSKKTQEYRLGFVEPYLLDSRWTAGGDIFRITSKTSKSYDSLYQGFDLRVGHPIFEYTRVYVTYNFADTKLSKVADPTINLEEENGISSSVETSMVYDHRNNRWEPTKGHYGRMAYEYVGLGGEQFYSKAVIDGRYYKSLIGELVLRTRLLTRKLFRRDGKPIPRNKKFEMGGARNMRGYSPSDIGPIRSFPEGSFNIGGLFSVYGTVEFEHPLVREAGLKWVVFFDAGNVYEYYMGKNGDYSLRMDWGFGIRWFSPIGPLRFEFGYPIGRKPGESGQQFHFDIGQLF